MKPRQGHCVVLLIVNIGLTGVSSFTTSYVSSTTFSPSTTRWLFTETSTTDETTTDLPTTSDVTETSTTQIMASTTDEKTTSPPTTLTPDVTSTSTIQFTATTHETLTDLFTTSRSDITETFTNQFATSTTDETATDLFTTWTAETIFTTDTSMGFSTTPETDTDLTTSLGDGSTTVKGATERRKQDEGTNVPVAAIVVPVIVVLIAVVVIAVGCIVYRRRGIEPKSPLEMGNISKNPYRDPSQGNPYINVGDVGDDGNRQEPTATNGNNYVSTDDTSRGTPIDGHVYMELTSEQNPEHNDGDHYTSLSEGRVEQGDQDATYYNDPAQPKVKEGGDKYFSHLDAHRNPDQHVYTSLDLTK